MFNLIYNIVSLMLTFLFGNITRNLQLSSRLSDVRGNLRCFSRTYKVIV